MRVVEIRCPVGPKRLFMRLLQEGQPPKVAEGNLMELACSDCARQRRKQGEEVLRVLHRYDILGALIETEVVRPSADDVRSR